MCPPKRDLISILKYKDFIIVNFFKEEVVFFFFFQIYDAYRNAKAKKLWDLKAYAMSNAQEYWAEGTGAFFHSNLLTYAAGKMNM